MLEHLGVADADVHGMGRLSQGAGLQEPELKNTTVARGQGRHDASDTLRSVRLGREVLSQRPVVGGLDRRHLDPEPATPVGREHGAGGRQEVGPHLAGGRGDPQGDKRGTGAIFSAGQQSSYFPLAPVGLVTLISPPRRFRRT